MDLNNEGTTLEKASLVLNTAANIFHLIPSFDVGGSGFGGSPVVKARWGGENLGQAASAMGQFLGGMGSINRSGASAVSVKAGYERRWDDWKLQEHLADRELLQIERQITAAEIRVEITRGELRNHEKQIEQAEAILTFLKDRSLDTAEWMFGQLSTSYFQAWEMAHRFTLCAERAFHFELGPKNERGEFDQYVRFNSWDSLRKGLLAGEKLLFDLKHMETDYLERNRRDFEITKHVSLVRLDPVRFLQLKQNGKCEIDLEDWLFDMDYPGHYFRRLKTVSLSIPCVVGPYVGVNCTLTLTKSQIRKKPEMGQGEDDEDNLLRNFSRIQSIATSGAQNDSGMFEVNFRDDRYLPFEGAGAISTWTLELDRKDNRQIDFDSISDVILHLKFTSRFGGKRFQKERRDAVDSYWREGRPERESNPDEGEPIPMVSRPFFVKDEFPAEWRRFEGSGTNNSGAVLSIAKLKDRMPYFSTNLNAPPKSVKLLGRDGKVVRNVNLFLDTPGEEPSEEPVENIGGIAHWEEAEWDKTWRFQWTAPGNAPDWLVLLTETNLQ